MRKSLTEFLIGDIIEDDKKIRKALRTVRIFQICSIVAILFFLPEIYLEYFRQELVPIAVLSRSNMNYLSIIMAALSIYSLWTAYFFPRMLLKSYKKSPLKRNYRPWSSLMIIQAIRVAMSTSVAIFGFVLGLFGVGWQITTLFFAVWVVSQALMFPTRKKWLSKAEEIKHALATDK